MNNRICLRCVMDTTAREIAFYNDGTCSFCRYFDQNIRPILDRAHSNAGKIILSELVNDIKESGKDKPFDSILGLSGGADSSYMACKAAELGLRTLLVHVDMGWNTPESEKNIRHLVSRLGYKLEIINIDWEEMVDLQLAFYKASVKNCEIPQDHIYLAALYRKADELNIRYILSGANYSTESILPTTWGYNAGDLRHLRAVHRRFGSQPLLKLPTLGFWNRYVYFSILKKIKIVRLLDYIPYNRDDAKRLLITNYDWQDYNVKHYESILTRFFQGYYLPSKFGIDKRKAHFSSLILSGQMERKHALEELEKPPYPDEEMLQSDKLYIADRLGLSLSEWEEILALPPRRHEEFQSSRALFVAKDMLVRVLGIRMRKHGL